MWEALAGGLVTGLLNNSAASARQEDSQAFNAQQFATRYQTTVADMKAAGLSPMLAYGQGGGAGASSSPASSPGMPDLGSLALQAKLNSAQVSNVEAQTELSSAQAAKARAEAKWIDPLSSGNLDVLGTTADVNRKKSGLIEAQTSQVVQAVDANLPAVEARLKDVQTRLAGVNIDQAVQILAAGLPGLDADVKRADAKRILAAAAELHSQYVLNMEKAKSEPFSRNVMQATAGKLVNESILSGISIKASEDLDNVGAHIGELKPMFDTIIRLMQAFKH